MDKISWKLWSICFMIVCVHASTVASKGERVKLRQVDCRKILFNPVCRGATAKRDIISNVDDEIRYPVVPETDYYNPELEKVPRENIVAMRNVLREILRGTLNRNTDYDSNTGQSSL